MTPLEEVLHMLKAQAGHPTDTESQRKFFCTDWPSGLSPNIHFCVNAHGTGIAFLSNIRGVSAPTFILMNKQRTEALIVSKEEFYNSDIFSMHNSPDSMKFFFLALYSELTGDLTELSDVRITQCSCLEVYETQRKGFRK